MTKQKVIITYSRKPIYSKRFGDNILGLNALDMFSEEEPSVLEGTEMDFDAMNEILDVLHENGISDEDSAYIMVEFLDSKKIWRSDGRVIDA